MNEFRTRALSCLAVATLLVVHASANAAVITIDTNTDGLDSGTRGGQFDWRDGYVELFGFDTYQGNLTDIAWDLGFSKTVETISPDMFSIVFVQRGDENRSVGQIGATANDPRYGDPGNPTIEGLRYNNYVADQDRSGAISAADALKFNPGSGYAESSDGFTFMNWTNGGDSADTSLSGSIDLGSEYLTSTVGSATITSFDAANLAAYYFMSYTAGKVDSGDAAPPAGGWAGTITFTSSGGSTGGAVPEPSTATMVAMGMMTLLGGLRRRRR